MSRSRKVLLVMLALAMVKVPLDVLLAAVLPDVSVDAAPQMMASAAVALLLLGMPALLLRPWKSVRLVRTEKLRPALLLGGTAALLARAAMTPVDAAWQQMLGLRPEALPAPESAAAVMMYILSLAVIPAVAEEAFFLQPRQQRLKRGGFPRLVGNVLLNIAAGDGAVLPHHLHDLQFGIRQAFDLFHGAFSF